MGSLSDGQRRGGVAGTGAAKGACPTGGDGPPPYAAHYAASPRPGAAPLRSLIRRQLAQLPGRPSSATCDSGHMGDPRIRGIAAHRTGVDSHNRDTQAWDGLSPRRPSPDPRHVQLPCPPLHCRCRQSWLPRALPRAEQRSALLGRLRLSELPIRDVYRHARKHPRVTLGPPPELRQRIGVTAGLSATASPVTTRPGAVPGCPRGPGCTGGRPRPRPSRRPRLPRPRRDHRRARAARASRSAPAPAQQAARRAVAQARRPGAAAARSGSQRRPQAAPAKTAAAQPPRASSAAGELAAPAQHAAAGQPGRAAADRQAAVGQRGRQHQGPGAVVGHLTQHKNHAGTRPGTVTGRRRRPGRT